ncbi:MAG TPA: bifunctional diaminohydroxyphosphoribosylaminopyrimidine deaminase/5-amino-6-(5-phosphoribosylamino)uracil reductase RibD [Firmicutes bacterium]|jgi:diaminohydroxyphosphoribosylaminopyrimidine deaminase/5-amino-6-(5-phosphoribosylamino)uracil reductase|nr:bifunctional diaminohydroxyphosphoribosylaminopyrimidine deaminase/5-amino-6-(5-phosphoribosylamino)uracil reductase RibD [Bacillota bacterium]
MKLEPDERYMWMALDLARRGLGKTNPNPMVGAVIVKGGEVVGTGFHEKVGERHAEVIALDEAGERARGATLYVNLEPCSHFGRTPPCVDAIIAAGVRKVVVACADPNPLVAGSGIRKLQEAGIKIKTGVLEEKAIRLNEVFFKYITTKMPFVVVKAAMTLDGKIATVAGKSRWISGEKSRKFVHRLRTMSDGIMVGINTVLNDDPQLTPRLGDENGRTPARIIVDSRGRLPLDANVVRTAFRTKTILATTGLASRDKIEALRSSGVEVLVLPSRDGRVDLHELMLALGKKAISVLLVEGGGTINYSLLDENLIDKVYFFVAPMFLGGESAPTPLEGAGVDQVDDSWLVEDMEIRQLDKDLLIIGYPAGREKVVHRDSGRIGNNIGSAPL